MFTAAPLSSMACPVAPLAREAMRLIRQMARHDGRSPELYDAAQARLSALEVCAAGLTATSQDGLYFHACVAYGAAETVWSWIPEDEQHEGLPARRMVEGAAQSLARAMAVPDLAPLADYYLPARIAEEVAA